MLFSDNDSLNSSINFKKPTSFVVNFDESSNANKTNNLQEAFEKYRNDKIEARKLYETNSARRKSFRSNPERMWKLRLKFVEQAKKYMGVPYAKKYFSPDSPEYHSKLFLDCCGLVRKVMRDLEDDFGFRIGPGNQGYMYDTLPIDIKNIEDVKPGDLVFISAIYYSDKKKKQPHNITHVEIMLGEGEKSLGARWNNGKIQIFDSYKFVSKSYHSSQYYIKSLDPWLRGYCKSYCYKHPWRYNTSKPGKKSIFSPYFEPKKKSSNLKRSSSKKSLTNISHTNNTVLKKQKKKKNKRRIKKYKTLHKNKNSISSRISKLSKQLILKKKTTESKVPFNETNSSNNFEDSANQNKENVDKSNVINQLSDESESVADSNCAIENSDSDSEFEYMTNSTSELSNKFSEYDILRKTDTSYYNQLYDENDVNAEDDYDDDDDIQINNLSIEKNLKVLSIN